MTEELLHRIGSDPPLIQPEQPAEVSGSRIIERDHLLRERRQRERARLWRNCKGRSSVQIAFHRRRKSETRCLDLLHRWIAASLLQEQLTLDLRVKRRATPEDRDLLHFDVDSPRSAVIVARSLRCRRLQLVRPPLAVQFLGADRWALVLPN